MQGRPFERLPHQLFRRLGLNYTATKLNTLKTQNRRIKRSKKGKYSCGKILTNHDLPEISETNASLKDEIDLKNIISLEFKILHNVVCYE